MAARLIVYPRMWAYMTWPNKCERSMEVVTQVHTRTHTPIHIQIHAGGCNIRAMAEQVCEEHGARYTSTHTSTHTHIPIKIHIYAGGRQIKR